MIRSRRLPALLLMAAVLVLLAARGPNAAVAQTPDGPPASPLTIGNVHILPAMDSQAEVDASSAAAAQSGRSGGELPRPAGSCPCGSGNLTYHGGSGGELMSSSTTYAIFWLPPGYHFEAPFSSGSSPTAADTSFESQVKAYFQDVGGSSFFNILTQYSKSIAISTNSTLGGSFEDHTAFPSGKGSSANPLLDTDIQNEVGAIVRNNGLTANWTTMFFVFTPLDVESCIDSSHRSCSATESSSYGTAAYCAYHSITPAGAIYANMPSMSSRCHATGQALHPAARTGGA